MAHVNEAVRDVFPVKKVTSSHTKRETVILTEKEIPELRKVVAEAGDVYAFHGLQKRENGRNFDMEKQAGRRSRFETEKVSGRLPENDIYSFPE